VPGAPDPVPDNVTEADPNPPKQAGFVGVAEPVTAQAAFTVIDPVAAIIPQPPVSVTV
jgi:hypothetical protein